MRDHVRILGILNIIMGCLTALLGVLALVFLGGIAGIITANGAGSYEDTHVAAPIMALIGVGAAVFFLILAAPSIIGGWGLLSFRPWARIVVIIVSVLHLLNFPFGTALGVYGLWVLLSDSARPLFQLPSYAPPYPGQPAQPPPASYPPQPPVG